MTSREEQRALTHLAELLASDLSKVSDADLIRGIQHAELVYASSLVWSGRLIAALRQSGDYSWPEITRLTGVARMTAWRRAEPYM